MRPAERFCRAASTLATNRRTKTTAGRVLADARGRKTSNSMNTHTRHPEKRIAGQTLAGCSAVPQGEVSA